MVLTAHQPVYLPWLGLFHKIWLAEKFVLFNTVQYLPKEWMNRNKIKTNKGEIWLTVPVLKKGFLNKKINEIKINNNIDWRRKHFRSIYVNYKKTKYFNYYIELLEEIYSKTWEYFSDLNEFMLRTFLKELNIKTTFLVASKFDFDGKKSDLVLNMCKDLGAKKYIFGAQGVNYADTEKFKASGIEVFFQNYQHPTYNQIHGNFKSNLSIIDLLFNCGKNSLDVIVNNQDNFKLK